jgi:oxygen-independent coproporphyrinogen-3 oxidase
MSASACGLADEMIAQQGRKRRPRVFRTIAWCRDPASPCGVDHDLRIAAADVPDASRPEAVVGAGVDHLTHYELNVGGRTDCPEPGHELPAGRGDLTTCIAAARDFLAEKGYRRATTLTEIRAASRPNRTRRNGAVGSPPVGRDGDAITDVGLGLYPGISLPRRSSDGGWTY